MKVVDISTQAFQATALYVGELPGISVLQVAGEKDEMRRALKLLEMFETAILDPKKLEQFRSLSFDAIAEVLNQYASSRPREYDMAAAGEELRETE